jgi:hypothetical protein
VKLRDLTGAVQFVANVMVPDDLAVGGVKKRYAVAAEVQGACCQSLGVPFGLAQYVLWAEREFLRFDDAEDLAADAEDVIRWAGLGGIFFDGTAVELRERRFGIEWDDLPAGFLEPAINELLTGEPFRVLGRGRGHEGGKMAVGLVSLL